MREYHIDTHNYLQQFLSTPLEKTFGGRKSVRHTGKPLMIVGQDESTYHQYVFSKKNWKTPTGRSQLVPKGVGEMYMCSGFQGQSLDWGV